MFITGISIEGGNDLIKSLKTIIGQIFRRLRHEFVSNTHIYIIVSEESRKKNLNYIVFDFGLVYYTNKKLIYMFGLI